MWSKENYKLKAMEEKMDLQKLILYKHFDDMV